MYTVTPAWKEGVANVSDNEPITVSVTYTNGSAYDNGTENARVGAGVWFGDSDKRNIHMRLPGLYQTNNAAKTQAILKRVLAAVQDETIQTISDSKYIAEGLCFHLK